MYRIQIAALRGRDSDNPKDRKHSIRGRGVQFLEVKIGGISNTLTSVGKDNLVLLTYV